jgi:hypothetical protein
VNHNNTDCTQTGRKTVGQIYIAGAKNYWRLYRLQRFFRLNSTRKSVCVANNSAFKREFYFVNLTDMGV